MNVLAIIQARMGSTRLPNKVLLDLEGKPLLEQVVRRVGKSRLINDIVIATTIGKVDLDIVRVAATLGTRVFCGSESDVLDRFYQVAKLLQPDHVVRITADCPLMDSAIIDTVIEEHIASKADYTTNTLTETFPDGEDVEVFTFAALKNAWENANLVSEREHVTPYIRKNPHVFRHHNIVCKQDLSKKRWTIDNPEDYEFIKIVYRNLYSQNPFFGMNDILMFLEQNPDTQSINSNINRNEGYQKSLANDKIAERKDD